MVILLLAFAPVFAIALFIWWKDKYDKEPIGLLVKSFLLGSLCCLPAGVTNELGAQLLDINVFSDNQISISKASIYAFLVVGLGEELFKFLCLIKYAFPKNEFNEPFDGIVYAVMISLGFAGLENVFYVAEGGAAVAVGRAFTAVPFHAVDGIIMGYFVGIAKFSEGYSRAANCFKGLLFAVLAHGFYDFFLFQGESDLIMILFFPYLFFLFFTAKKAMNSHLMQSPFKNKAFCYKNNYE